MKKEYDFSKSKKVDTKRVWKDPKVMISLRLDAETLLALKDEAQELGIGYQTHISNILAKHFDPSLESMEERIYKKVLTRLSKKKKKVS